MKPCRQCFVLGVLATLLLQGCTNVAQKLGDVNNSLSSINQNFDTALVNQRTAITKQQEVVTKLEANVTALENSRKAVDKNLQKDATAVVDLLQNVDKAATPQADNALAGAKQYAGSLQAKLGVYAEPDRVAAAKITSGAITQAEVKDMIEVDRNAYNTLASRVEALVNDNNDLKGQLKVRQDDLDASTGKLAEIGGQISTLRGQISWERFKAFIKTPVGIVVAIAVVVAFPAVIPLIGALVGQLVSLFPALMSFFGVASKGTVDRVTQGVGNFKDELDKVAHKGQIGVEEVRAMLKRELLTATDSRDRRVIDHIRETRNVS